MSSTRDTPLSSWDQWPPPVVQYEEPDEILADALLETVWCAAEHKIRWIGHLELDCDGPHYSIVVDELIEPEPEPVHFHSPQIMRDATSGVPKSVTCTGVDGCGLNEYLSTAWALPALGGV